MILPKKHILSCSLISDHIDENQFQPAGVDLTLKKVFRFSSPGRIDFDNKERKISEVEEIGFKEEWTELEHGAYKVLFNEYVRIPTDVAAFCFPRSSLLRCGITLECAVWDPGYHGRSEALLLVKNQQGAILKKNARIAQMVFLKLIEETEEYSGAYKGENK